MKLEPGDRVVLVREIDILIPPDDIGPRSGDRGTVVEKFDATTKVEFDRCGRAFWLLDPHVRRLSLLEILIEGVSDE